MDIIADFFSFVVTDQYIVSFSNERRKARFTASMIILSYMYAITRIP